ncbi:MAG: cobalt-precorrin 5A hydrolase [Desulfobacteraceae bacterium]|nr:cobalt-precorrin 5A hydrolase [Desulfobacteraceae bacterium]
MDTDKPQNNKNSSQTIAVWAITPNGLTLGQDICTKVPGAELFWSEQLVKDGQPIDRPSFKPGAEPGSNPGLKPGSKPDPALPDLIPELSDQSYGQSSFKSLSEELSRQFTRFCAHIFIFSTGIAVRMLAPLIQSKTTDPGVIVVDDKGIHAISLLSGHLGGANGLTEKIAGLINAKAVITTATDINGLPSMDLIAQANNLYIENPGAIKYVNMVFLKGNTVDVHDPADRVSRSIPKDFIHGQNIPKQGTGVICTWKTIKVPRETLILRPRILSVGIGCNRNTSMEMIHDFLKLVLRGEGLSLNAVFTLASTEVKNDEPGLLNLADRLNLPLKFYDKNQLNSVDTIETPSKMVEKHLGVKSVCEAAAILAAGRGRLIVPKKKNRDVTLAVAIKE